jgi:vacuolar-type H+-ATPase subunit F/Vma7
MLITSCVLTKLCIYYATETTDKQIEDAFKELTAREDIAIVLIS